MLAGLADLMQTVVVGWQHYAVTNDLLGIGPVGLAWIGRLFLQKRSAGPAADRLDRRWVDAFAPRVGAVDRVVLAVAMVQGASSRGLILGLSVVGAVRTLAVASRGKGLVRHSATQERRRWIEAG